MSESASPRYSSTLPAVRITLSHSLRHAVLAAADAADGVRRSLPGDALTGAFEAAAETASGRAGGTAGRLREAFDAAYRAVPSTACQAVRESVGMAILGAPDLLASTAVHKAAVDALFKRFGYDTIPSPWKGVIAITDTVADRSEGRLAVFGAMRDAAAEAARSVRDGTCRYVSPTTEQEASFDAEGLASILAVRASRAVRRQTALDAAIAATLKATGRNPPVAGETDRWDGALAAALAEAVREGADQADVSSEVADLARAGAAERAAGTARRITLEAVYGTIIGGVHRTSRGVLPFASNYDAALLGACGLEHPSKLEAAILEDVGAEPPTGYSWGGALGDAYPEVRPINYLEAGRSLDYLGLRIFYETIHYVAYPAARSART